ncbi:peptidyl-prolyl cis-trans isomerase [Karstenula rhodostoma CBS 690.94]|uniref:peptidylprolyl isomerase n=1 Tax=Karstenula rhodostoma CBS 690.94 TaxID=1392251 RepID=A0A9P4U6B2_9PLEO|nr:peptidyl-prolyl cis-trans isomerase [Karstenula rhodostoma CBS 690.94]
MGVEKQILKEGDGVTFPKKHDEVAMEYTGWLYDESQEDKKGKKFDSSVGRGNLVTEIGVGRVIRGWDEGLLGSCEAAPMSLGEKATLIITPDYGYGDRGFPGFIPPNAMLVFDVELKVVNGTKAS